MTNDKKISNQQLLIMEKIRGYSTFIISKNPQSRNKLFDRIKNSKHYPKYKELFDDDTQIIEMLDHFERIQLLDDYQIARSRVRSRIRMGWGKTKILSNVPPTLMVSRDIVQQCIDEAYDEFELESENSGNQLSVEVQLMLNQLSKETLESLNDQKTLQRIYRRFASRGFSYSKSKEAVEAKINELN